MPAAGLARSSAISGAHDLSGGAALREAVDKGWADVAAGRYIDVADEDLNDYIAGLGKRATKSTSAG
jgi:hypothetical protein